MSPADQSLSPPPVETSTGVGVWVSGLAAASSPRPSSPVLAILEEGIKGRGLGAWTSPRPPCNPLKMGGCLGLQISGPRFLRKEALPWD